MPPSPSWKVVYAVVDKRLGRGQHWLRIGMAFVNRDGSLNVRLDAVPLTGQLHIRDPPRSPESSDPLPDIADAMPQTTPPEVPTERKHRP